MNIPKSKNEQAVIQGLLDKAALMGPFLPERLMENLPSDLTALNRFAEACTEVESSAGTTQWQLRADVRRRTLSQMHSSGRLIAMAQSIEADEQDPFGTYLRAALIGRMNEAGSLEDAELNQLHSAVQFARPYADEGLRNRIDGKLARRDAEGTIEFVRPRRLVGRNRELKALHRFATVRSKRGQTALVTGIGGSGKSALLAELVSRVRGDAWTGTPVIWFDFDRALFEANDPAAMLLELTRQYALHRPELSTSLSEFRREWRERWRPARGYESDNFQRSAVNESELWSLWRDLMGFALPFDEPVLLVLDTFEEILFRDRIELDRISRWVENLRVEGGFSGIRTIISGRIGRDIAERDFAGKDIYQLDDLRPRAARQLIRDFIVAEGLDADRLPLSDLLEVTGGHPLMLKLAARFCAAVGQDNVRAALQNGDLDLRESVAEGFLYTRVLARIRSTDPDVTKLAHPGLALRRVTPHLIQHVLAETCDLAPIDEKRSRDLFEELTKQVWLVERTGPDQAVHRQELRRHMLPQIAAREPTRYESVHKAAARYYAAHRDPSMPPSAQDLERRYHSLFFAHPDSLGEQPTLLAGIVGPDIDALPIPIRARLKAELSHTLTAAEAQMLDRETSRRHVTRQATARLKAGADLFGSAAPEASPSAVDSVSEVHARFDRMEVDRVIDVFFAATDEIMNEVAASESVHPPLQETALWKVGMACLVRSDRMPAFLSQLARSDGDARNDRLSYACSRVSALLTGDRVKARVPFLVHNIETVEQLRDLQLQAPAASERTFLTLAVLPYLSDDLRDWMANTAVGRVLSTREGDGSTLADLRRPLASKERLVADDLSPSQMAIAMRGTTPELHGPLRVQLARLDIDAMTHFTSTMDEHFPWWPKELMPSNFARAVERERSRWSATLIEVTDLAGRLGSMIDFVQQELPSDQKASLLARLWSRYDRRLQRPDE